MRGAFVIPGIPMAGMRAGRATIRLVTVIKKKRIDPMTVLSVNQMRGDGFAVLPYPGHISPRLERVAKAWKKFTSLPCEVRTKLTYLPDNPQGNSGTGYEPPDPTKHDARKHTYHVQHRDAAWLLRKSRAATPVATWLANESLELLEELKPYIGEFGSAFEREFNLDGFTDNLMRGFDEWILRLLWYPPGYAPGEVIAKEHCDKGGGTLHLWETCPGVERLTFDTKEWVTFPVGNGESVVFSGMRMQYLTECATKALCHRVVATDEAAHEGRFSAVLFLNLDKVPYYDKARLGSTQSLPAGFNYDLPFAEFSQYFAQGKAA